MNLALYREFRPKTFEEVIGQNHITKTLINQVKNNNITHAYLFTGARGTGKTSCAKIFSKAINCLNNKNGSPCGECENCKALSIVNTDVMEIDAASNNRVDEIRDLREMVKYPPVIGKKKVYIIDEVHMLTESAFNALLKTLEEPPEYVVFILATTEVHKLPATILSRCTRFDFRLLSVDELVGQLKKVFDARGISYDEESLYTIARQGEGSVRDSLSIADAVLAYSEKNVNIEKTLEVLGLSSTKIITDIARSIGENDINGLFNNVQTAVSSGKNVTVLCRELTECFKNLVLINQNICDFKVLDIMPSELDLYKDVAKLFTQETLKIAFEKLTRIELDLKYSLDPKNLILSTCLSVMNLKSSPNVENTSPQIKSETNSQPASQQEIKVEISKVESVEPNKTILNSPQETNWTNMQKVDAESLNSVFNSTKQTSTNETGKVWGEVLLKIKEKNLFAFSASLKNVYGVEISNNCLELHTNDLSVYNAINTDDKKSLLVSILKELNYSIGNIEIIYDENNKSKNDIIKNLKETFLDKIKIKE